MTIEVSIRQQLTNLIKTGEQLAVGNPAYPTSVRDEKHLSECVGWLASAEQTVATVCRMPDDAYRRAGSAIVMSDEASN